MDRNSSGEDVLIKLRKPYTISKQRERWTEEEHDRFLEALKLYGRAWQRIEDHIGTKTAVQIRSHAQKFFSKLEKEALVKGVPISQALEIDIPPPRPKRKPSNPYPRNNGACAPTSQAVAKDGKLPTSVSSSLPGNQILDLEKVLIPEEPGQVEEPANSKENQDDNGSDVFTFSQEAPCTSVSSANKNSRSVSVPLRKSCSFRDSVPPSKEVINQEVTNESYITVEPEGNQRLDKSDSKETILDIGASQASNLGNSYTSQEKIAQGKETENPTHLKLGDFPTDEMHVTQNYPRHVPVHILDGRTCTQTSFSDISYQESMFHQGIHGRPSLFSSPAASASIEHEANMRSSIHQSFPTFHPPFTPICDNQEDYQSFVQFSSAFSSLILSTLLQNPAAHAAASFAASFLPCSNVNASAESPACTAGCFPLRQMIPAPSMAAIAAATVAAATAWWAAHGLLPMCTPLHSGFPSTPASATAAPSMDTDQTLAAKNERRENTLHDPLLKDQLLEAEYSEALQAQHSASKLPLSSSSDSEELGGGKLDNVSKAVEQDNAVVITELDDSNKTKGRKQTDRSSCGSNAPSSSEVETDALEKHEKAIEESNEPETGHPTGDSMNRRSRSTFNVNESWKEVSERGRLAFQALFARHELPQSFSPPHDLKNKGHQKNAIEEDKQNADEKDENPLLLDLNTKTWGSCLSQGIEKNALLTADNREEGLLTNGLGHGKLKARRTGFKPYKRCSAEAKDRWVANASFQGEEKCPKRLRLEGEALT